MADSSPRAVICKPVFFSSALITLLILIFSIVAGQQASTVFAEIQNWVANTFGWFYILAVALFLIFMAVLAFSSFGKIKLGPDHAQPDYTSTSWFAMLFAAGMGIGLLFFGVAEPIMHYNSPPVGEGGTTLAARQAMSITFFHWGLHAWAIYAVIGLSLAYFSFRHRLPLTIRSALYPLIGERIYGPIGHVVDTFAVIGTLFGIATSLGFGVLQINAGLTHLTGLPENVFVQVALIAVITLFATGSVVAGLDAGIKRLSELNLILAAAMLLFVLVTGPTLHLLQTFVQNTGAYLDQVVGKTFNLYAYEPTGWIGGWTLFYWGWWISWSPFVGMFIARVSRGRTIREFVGGVLLIPCGFTFLWMTVFGNTAIWLETHEAGGALAATIAESVPLALFTLLEYLPWSTFSATVAVILIILFFVTSADSGSLVVDSLTAGGATNTPVWQRIFWAVGQGAIAAVLLLSGGLAALQSAVIAGALPFVIVMLLICWGLWRGLRMEGLRELAHGLPSLPAASSAIPWQKRLRGILHYPTEREVEQFLNTTVAEALGAVEAELRSHDLQTRMEVEPQRRRLTVYYEGVPDFIYAVEMTGYAAPRFALTQPSDLDLAQGREFYRAEVHLAEGGQQYDVVGWSRDQLISDILNQYEKHMHFLHISSTE